MNSIELISKKEIILLALEKSIKTIKLGESPKKYPMYKYCNTVTYVDRQYLSIDPNEVVNAPKPWILINNMGEDFKLLPSKLFENKIHVDIVGFVECEKDGVNLDSLMNSLQRDIFAAILSDETLNQTASYVVPISIQTVPIMINPYGGFVMMIDIVYVFSGLNI